MLPSQLNSSPKRANPFGRALPSASQNGSPRPKSAIIGSPSKIEAPKAHFRNSASVTQLTPTALSPHGDRDRPNPSRNSITTGTFAPEFIKSEELQRGADQIRGLEGENDFSGNKYVWLKDPEKAFVRGLVLEEWDNGRLLAQTDDGEVRSLTMPIAHCTADTCYSSGKWMRIKLTRSTRPNSTKQTIWQNSHI